MGTRKRWHVPGASGWRKYNTHRKGHHPAYCQATLDMQLSCLSSGDWAECKKFIRMYLSAFVSPSLGKFPISLGNSYPLKKILFQKDLLKVALQNVMDYTGPKCPCKIFHRASFLKMYLRRHNLPVLGPGGE